MMFSFYFQVREGIELQSLFQFPKTGIELTVMTVTVSSRHRIMTDRCDPNPNFFCSNREKQSCFFWLNVRAYATIVVKYNTCLVVVRPSKPGVELTKNNIVSLQSKQLTTFTNNKKHNILFKSHSTIDLIFNSSSR
jgi:hypothetical protein